MPRPGGDRDQRFLFPGFRAPLSLDPCLPAPRQHAKDIVHIGYQAAQPLGLYGLRRERRGMPYESRARTVAASLDERYRPVSRAQWRRPLLLPPGIHAAPHPCMSHTTNRNPRSYEEIVRKTVVDPDFSTRPTIEQEQAAREGFRALEPVEQALHDRVLHALARSGADLAHVTIEVSRDLVILRGRVADVSQLQVLEDTVASVIGVTTIHDQVVVGPDRSS
jgi:hypothetical protein